MEKKESNLDDLYLLNKVSWVKKTPRILDDLKKTVETSRPVFFDWPLARYVSRTKKSSLLLPAGKRGRMENFLSGQFGRSVKFSAPIDCRRVDSLFLNPQGRKMENVAIVFETQKDFLWEDIKERYSSWTGYYNDLIRGALPEVSLARAWNVSIIGAVIFGMITMTFIYRYLGESVSAKLNEEKEKNTVQTEIKKGQVWSAEDYEKDEAEVEFITKLLQDFDKNGKAEAGEKAWEKEIRTMVEGYPIEEMIPEIVKQDRIIAAFLVSIAKKESNWGKRVPVLDGQDCYNYWGYRGIRKRMGTGGHTCFDSRKDAVDTVAKRMATLINEYGKNNPEKMVIWKCGSDCEATGGQAAANKWIADVNLYFKKLNK